MARVANSYLDIDPPDDLRQDEKIRQTLEPVVPPNRFREFNWALIDIGQIYAQEPTYSENNYSPN